MVKVSAGALKKWQNVAEAAKRRVDKIKEKGEELATQAVKTAMVGGTALSLGLIQGKTGGLELVGVPFDLFVAAGAHVGGFLGAAGKASPHLHTIGDAAIAVYASTVGRAIGVNWKTTGKLALPSGAKMSGIGALPPGMSGEDGLSDAEIAAQIVRR